MGGHKSISCSTPPTYQPPPPPPPPPDFIVTGNINPDAKGNYFHAGTINGKPYYTRTGGGWHISWISFVFQWIISNQAGGYGTRSWYKSTGTLPPGNYTPIPPCTGTATVTAG